MGGGGVWSFLIAHNNSVDILLEISTFFTERTFFLTPGFAMRAEIQLELPQVSVANGGNAQTELYI